MIRRFFFSAAAAILLLMSVLPAAGWAEAEGGTAEETVTADLVLAGTGQEDERQALVEGYIHKTLYAGQRTGLLQAVRLAGSSLKGVDRKLYLKLYGMIGRVAAGAVTSTVFSFPVEDVYAQWTFTAEELGVEAILANGTFAAEARTAITGRIKSFDAGAIVKALLADCPYELYWYNKAEGGCRIGYPNYSSDGDTVTLKGNVTFSMAVAQEYAAGEYETDPAVGQAVNAAAENALRIAERYEDRDDYERLKAYKDEICGLASYNHAAAGDETVPYGNPWQLIWVFDGDPDTSVVCEGYAKAFQYLNELSLSSVQVISPQGSMNGASHMWNLVTMSDGKTYLVDVTNCDSGMAGYPDKLFLAGAMSGSTAEGYRVSTGSGSLLYQYSQDTAYSQSQLRLSSWSYLDGRPPVPEFLAAETDVYEQETLSFSYRDAGYAYDGILAQVERVPVADGTAEISEKMVEIGAGGQWTFVPAEYGPGDFRVSFSGLRDGVQSDWSSPAVFRVAAFEEYVPAYDFSSAVGYTGYQLAVRVREETDGVLLRETGERLPCADGIVLIPLPEAGENRFTLAILWQGRASSFGQEGMVTTYDAPQDALALPEGVTEIEAEAFRQTGARAAHIPESVLSIGPYAFADNPGLLLMVLHHPQMDGTALEGSPDALLCTDDPAWGFKQERPFLVR